ncbi:MAG: transcription termination/antitermination NusG family protein [Bryobacteraceae bacterium]|jgi:transcription antitermination factor NusG
MTVFPWYALQVASRCEKAVASGLALRGYREFLPLFHSRRKWSDRLQDVDLPLFPGYVFCRLEVNHRLPALQIPGVVRIVGLGKVPIPVDEDEIAAVESIVRSGLLAQPWPFLKVGQTVTIEDGPLRSVSGIVTEINGADHLIVSITLLQRSLAVAIARNSIRPADAAGDWTKRRQAARN